MIRWVGSLFGLEPVKTPVEHRSTAAQTYQYLDHAVQVPTGVPWATHTHHNHNHYPYHAAPLNAIYSAPDPGGQPHIYSPHPHQQQHSLIQYPQTAHFPPGQIPDGRRVTQPAVQQPGGIPALRVVATEPRRDSDDEFEWPEGLKQRKEIRHKEPKDWAFSSWAWHSNGNVDREESIYPQLGKAEIRQCCGVLQCTRCSMAVRPKTRRSDMKVQMSEGCASPCDGVFRWLTCDARCYRFVIEEDGVEYSIWEHSGSHYSHPRPPGGRRSPRVHDAIDQQVTRHHDASAYQLRTGDLGPGSVPLHRISPALADPRAARYELSKSKERLGINPKAHKGGFHFMRSLGEWNTELADPFVVDSNIAGPIYIVLQTPFMNRIANESVDDWIKDPQTGSVVGRHGFVTDIDHGYFRDGNLMMTCAFSGSGGMEEWVPVLYSWLGHLDAAHHRPHFRKLFRDVVDHAGESFRRDYLTNVLDYSAAQRLGRAEEYAETMTSLLPSFCSLSKEAQDIERKRYIDEAQATTKGCATHFSGSVLRIKRTESLVPTARLQNFDSLIHQLMSPDTTSDDFDRVAEEISTQFPRVQNWIQWWLRPVNASMIFPAKRVMSPELAEKVPNTSNPAEHRHSNLHMAVGEDHDLFSGIKNLYLHMQEMEAHYNAIKDGHCMASEPRGRKYRKLTVKWDANDGRPPDTADALAAVDKEKLKRTKKSASKKSTVTVPSSQFIAVSAPRAAMSVTRTALMSYKWSGGNSCFFDVGLALWFAAFSRWPIQTREAFVRALPSNTVLASVFNHYERRIKWLMTGHGGMIDGRRELMLGQDMARYGIFNQLELYENNSSFGCARTWLTRGVAELPDAIQTHFGVQHQLHSVCTAGHKSSCPAAKPQVIFNLITNDIDATRTICGPNATLQDHLEHMIPRRLIGNDHAGTTLLHTLPDSPCTDPSCNRVSTLSHIETAWPDILHVCPESISYTPGSFDREALPLPRSFVVKDVRYDMVGRIHYHGNEIGHFTCDRPILTRLFKSDDMQFDGDFVDVGSADVLEEPDLTVQLVMYHRSTDHKVTVRDIEAIKVDHEKCQRCEVDGTGWDRDNDLVSSVKISEAVKLNVATQLTPTTESRVGELPLLENTVKPKQPGLSAAEKKRREVSPWPLQCDGCGEVGDGYEAEGKTVQCDTCKNWSHTECFADSFELSVDNDDGTWSCPLCRNIVVWADSNIGCFVLFETVPCGKRYAARILSREGRNANLIWHTGNIYATGEAPPSPTFTRLARDCTEAIEDAFMNAAPHSKVGTIRWPLRFQDDAADHEYGNDVIQTALYESYSAVFDVMVGAQSHPIITLFDQHMEKERKKFAKDYPKRIPSRNDLLKMAHRFPFSVPVLPGDASLVETFLADIKVHAHREKLNILDEDLTFIRLGSILFHLVILRTYLGRPVENDLDIYELVEGRKISRAWTAHEQALAACHGEDDTSSHARFDTPPDPTLWKVKVYRDTNLALSDVQSFVTVQTAGPVIWTNRPGLTGGTRRPRWYRPPYIRLAPPGPRPQPRPAYGKHATNSMEGTDGRSVKRNLQDIEVDMPAKKRRIAKRGRVTSSSEEETRSPGSPGTLRRSTRARAAKPSL